MSEQWRGTLRLIAVACLIVFALCSLISIPLFWEQARVLRTWPVRQAIVSHSGVLTQAARRHGQLYSAHIEIAYVVNGQPVTTELTSFQSDNYQAALQRAADFPVGSRHAIRYDPGQPNQVRVDASWSRRFFAVPLMTVACGAFFGLLAAGLFIAARGSGALRAETQSYGAS